MSSPRLAIVVAAARDNVDLAPVGAVAARQNLVQFQSQPERREALRAQAEVVVGAALSRGWRVRAHFPRLAEICSARA
jgi:predicted GNAT superfamily acetyltransferase